MGAQWLEALEDVGGNLVPAARDFVDSQRPPMPGVGASGVRWLASVVEDFVDSDDVPADDDRFVEGAGAVLGLLLIEHLGGQTRERDGCHRVQLGRFGWFDPFSAIEAALDADDPRGCLSDHLSIAEREAEQEGPVSRVVSVFADALGEERPELEIESQFGLAVDLSNGASVDLARLERVSQDQDDEAATQAAKRIVSMLPGAESDPYTPWHEAAPRLLPRLVSQSFLDSLPSSQALYVDDVGRDVHLSLQLRYETRARYIRSSEVDAWPLERAAARQQALENLAERSKSLRLEPVDDKVVRVRTGDGLDGARLLLPDLAARLDRIEAGMWVASSPHRDVLLLARAESVEALGAHAHDAAKRAPHPVSPALFVVTTRGPRPLPG